MSRVTEFDQLNHCETNSVTDQPGLWKEGQGILLECDGEKWVAEIVMRKEQRMKQKSGPDRAPAGQVLKMLLTETRGSRVWPDSFQAAR
jgi:hypothetical protein